jgi:hypothetical protein
LATPIPGAVTQADAARVEPAREPLLDVADQLDQSAQAPVVLRLAGQMRKPTRQHPADQARELPIRVDPDRRLRDRQRDQLRVSDQRLAATTRRDRILGPFLPLKYLRQAVKGIRRDGYTFVSPASL